MFTGLNLSDMIFSPNHRKPSGEPPSSPVIIKTQIILFSVTFSTLHVHHRDWFSVNSLQEDDQICVPERWYTDRLQELQSVSRTKPCLGWCWHSSCHALKKHTDFIFSDARIPGENAKQREGTRAGADLSSSIWAVFILSLPPWNADMSLDSHIKPTSKSTLFKFYCDIFMLDISGNICALSWASRVSLRLNLPPLISVNLGYKWLKLGTWFRGMFS